MRIPQIIKDKINDLNVSGIYVISFKSSRKIICINNGNIYESQLAAAVDLKIKQGHISEVLNGKRCSVKGYKFKKFIGQIS